MVTDADRREVDMSPAAIDRRLREVASLYRLGISIGKAKKLGRRRGEQRDQERMDPDPPSTTDPSA